MGQFFELYKIKKNGLLEEEQRSIVLDQISEDLAFDTSLDNEETVELYKMQRFHSGPAILAKYFRESGHGDVWETAMFLSPKFINEIIQALESSDEWTSVEDKNDVVYCLKKIVKEVDFDTEYLFYTYF